MNFTERLLAGLLLLLAAHSAAAGGLLKDFSAQYVVRINSLKIGESEVALETQRDGRYLYRSLSRSTGIAKWFRGDTVRESSLFLLHDGRPRPLQYRFDHAGGKKERHALLDFDWQAGKVANTVEGHTWEMKIPADALDKMIVQLAVMMDLTDGKQKLGYAVADGGKLKEYQFAVVGEDRVKVPAGEFATVKLQRLRKDNDRTTHFWCAPALDYLPVRIEQIEHEDGVTFLSELKRTTIGDRKAPNAVQSK